MPWNGLGTYVLPPAYYPETNGNVIDAVRYDGLVSDIAVGVTNALNKNGENSPSTNINWGGFKIANLGAGTVAGDSLMFGQSGQLSALGLGMSPVNIIDATTSNASTAAFKLINSNAGVGAFAAFYAQNDGGKTFQSGMTSGAYTGIAFAGANCGLVYSNGAGGLGFLAADAAGTIRFGTGVGATERGRFASAGQFFLGTTTLGIGASVNTLLNLGGAATVFGSLKATGGEELLLGVSAAAVYLGAFSSTQFSVRTNNIDRMTFAAASADITAQGVGITRVKAALTNRSNVGTFADDPDLIVPLGVGRWAIHAWLDIPASGAGANAAGLQVKCAFSGTQNASPGQFFSNLNTLASGANGVTDLTTGTSSAGKTTGTLDWMTIDGTINVTVAGNFSIQWSQLVASATGTLTFAAGSYITCTKVA